MLQFYSYKLELLDKFHCVQGISTKIFEMRLADAYVYVSLSPTPTSFCLFCTHDPYTLHESILGNRETPGVLLTLFAFDSQRFSAIEAYRVTD